ncbi:MAG: AzlD domain-containing protein [Oscillospiraceae bacterium]
MSDLKLCIYIFVMAGVTYLIRFLPMVLFKKKINNRFLNSFLYYIPYAVLGAMTFPAILYSTGSMVSATVGLCVAVILAFLKRGLLTVATVTCIVVFIIERLL